MKVMPKLMNEVDKKTQELHHFKEEIEEEVVDEAALLLRRRSTVIPPGVSGTTASDGGEVAVDLDASKVEGDVNNVEGDEGEEKFEEIVYFDKSEGSERSHFNAKLEDLGLKDVDINQVLSAVINGKEVNNLKDKLSPVFNLPTSTKPQLNGETDQHAKVDEELLEESDEEVVELEFERAVEKIHTHGDYNMYCPSCSRPITKVVLRRKGRPKRVPNHSDTRRDDLFGCLSCLRIFFPPGRGFDLSWIFGKRRPVVNGLASPLLPGADIISSSPKVRDGSRDQVIDPGDGGKIVIPHPLPLPPVGTGNFGPVPRTPTPSQDPKLKGNVIIDIYNKTGSQSKGQNGTLDQLDGGDVRIPVEETPVEQRIPKDAPPITDVLLTGVRIPETTTESQGSRSLEIVKSIVYGGLMESITSLSVVSSAAASDATTLNIVALGLANLVGGLVVLAHNLKDLRYGDSSETNENRYKEQLGRKENFILHATIAVLSYLVFGLIPPVIYGFTFRASDDRDYKLLAVAVASLLCIVILAIAKAYGRVEHTRGEHKFMAYFKTIMYYVTSAVAAAGIAFAVGDLVKKLIERLGWLNPATVEPQLFTEAKSFNPTSWASY